MKNITAKEMKNIVKAEMDNMIARLAAEYGIEALTSGTVQRVLETEAGRAVEEIKDYGKILNNKERWS